MGGDFFYIGSQTRSCIGKLSTTGTGLADATWNPNATISGDYPAVYCFALSGGNIYVGGYFTSIGGQTRYGIAKLSTTGTGAADATWNPSADASVLALAVSGTAVYAGGGFTSIGNQPRVGLARLSSTGVGFADPAWNPNADASVSAVLVNGLCVYAGGSFANIGGCARAGLAKLSTLGSGGADDGWVADCNGEVSTLVSTGTGLYLGGAFTQVAGQLRAGVAALTYPAPQLLAPSTPAPGQFQCTLTGERGQGFEILASTNLVNWDTVCCLTNASGNTYFIDTTPGLRQRFYRARQLP